MLEAIEQLKNLVVIPEQPNEYLLELCLQSHLERACLKLQQNEVTRNQEN